MSLDDFFADEQPESDTTMLVTLFRTSSSDFGKARSICPSCTARRMADTAAHLVTRVLPRAPFRQWVFTVPKPLRLVLARDPAWARWVGQLVVRAISAWQRHIARARGFVAPTLNSNADVQVSTATPRARSGNQRTGNGLESKLAKFRR